jgi:hypothetical protein
LAVALYASAQSVCWGTAPWWGAAGLLLALPFAALAAWGERSGLGFALALLGFFMWAGWRWRVSQEALAKWRSERDRDLRDKLRDSRRQRNQDS